MGSLRQVTEAFLPLGVVLPEEGEGAALGQVFDGGGLLYSLAVGGEILPPTLEGTAGTEHGLEVAEVALEQEHLPGCQVVEPPAPAHHRRQLLFRQAFIEQRIMGRFFDPQIEAN